MPTDNTILTNAALAGIGILLVTALGVLWHLHSKMTELYGIVAHPELGIVKVLTDLRDEMREEFKAIKERVGSLERRRG